MKIRIDIKSIFGNVLFSLEKGNNTIKDTLEEANLRGAYLGGAYLEEANLRDAYLRGANLEDADYSEYTSFLLLQCPIEGSFIGWKKCDGYIVKLKICEDAERSSSTSLKCRCSKAEVLEI